MLKKWLWILLVFALILPACSTNTIKPTPATATADVTPTPKTPDKGMGMVVGTLVRKGSQPEKPYAGVRVFLGSLILDTNGKATVASVDPNNDPQTRTDENGNFAFNNIKPGTYILAAQLPPVQLIKLKKSDGTEMLITIEADKVSDLGKLYYDFPFPEEETAAPYPPTQPTQPDVSSTPYP